MVCKKFNTAKILIMVLASCFFLNCSFISSASNDVGGDLEESFGRATFEFNGQYYEYSRGNLVETGESRLLYSEPVYIVHSYCKENNYHYITSAYDKPYRMYKFNNGQFDYDYTASFVESVNCYNISTYSNRFEPSTYPFYEFETIEECQAFRRRFVSYVGSDYFVPINSVVSVKPDNLRFDDDFSLRNVSARVESGVLICNWNVPDNLPLRYTDMPLFVNLRITNLDNGNSSHYKYPLESSLPDANMLTFYDVSHKELRLSLSDVPNLPERFKVDFVALEPYYRVPLLALDGYSLYKGQRSVIYLNYSGTFNGLADYGAQQIGSIQLQPDDSVPITTPEDNNWDILTSIKNFFGGFFNNFGNMLKNLFIPTKEQMQSLFADMENFFSDKLGFLWFPFDLAITIVETFTYGEADSIITVPPISINILGGLDLYDGGQFDMDAVGIFPYVRMVSSLVLACSVAGLAYNKWDEWIGGHDK